MSQYQVRGLPCNIRPDHELWSIVGWYRDGTGGGILEWCYDELDARRLLQEIRRDPAYVNCRVVGPENMRSVYEDLAARICGQG
jgi:hypothetical protein